MSPGMTSVFDTVPNKRSLDLYDKGGLAPKKVADFLELSKGDVAEAAGRCFWIDLVLFERGHIGFGNVKNGAVIRGLHSECCAAALRVTVEFCVVVGTGTG